MSSVPNAHAAALTHPQSSSRLDLARSLLTNKAEQEAFAKALHWLQQVSQESIEFALANLEFQESVGPFTRPLNFVEHPESLTNLQANRELLTWVAGLREVLPDETESSG